jgi:flagellar biosynthesis/type III secretory pathway chaperone
MPETFADRLERFRALVSDQIVGYRRLLETTRAGTRALERQDADEFDRILAEQVDILRRLKEHERERRSMVREVGSGDHDNDLGQLQRDLRRLAEEVSRANRAHRLVIERNGALVDARISLHRRVGTLDRVGKPGINQFA